MKKIFVFFIIIGLSGCFSDKPYVGFWEFYSLEYRGDVFTLQNSPRLQHYLDITKNNKNSYDMTSYEVSVISSNGVGVEGFGKYNSSGTLKGAVLIRDYDEGSYICSLKENGDSMQCVSNFNKERRVYNFAKTNKSDALDYMRSKKDTEF